VGDSGSRFHNSNVDIKPNEKEKRHPRPGERKREKNCGGVVGEKMRGEKEEKRA